MLDRWSKNDSAVEPDWDIDDVLPLSLRDRRSIVTFS
jgi:hypothetical protein